jgi:hypothetical protein
MPTEGFEPVISVSEWPQNHAIDRTAAYIRTIKTYLLFIRKTNIMHRLVQVLYSMYWLLHVSAVACHHQEAS